MQENLTSFEFQEHLSIFELCAHSVYSTLNVKKTFFFSSYTKKEMWIYSWQFKFSFLGIPWTQMKQGLLKG